MRYHLTPVKWPLSKQLQTAKVGKDVEKSGPCTLLVEMQIGTITMKNSMEIPHKTKNRTTYDPEIPFLGTTSRENQNMCAEDTRTCMQKKTRTCMQKTQDAVCCVHTISLFTYHIAISHSQDMETT